MIKAIFWNGIGIYQDMLLNGLYAAIIALVLAYVAYRTHPSIEKKQSKV